MKQLAWIVAIFAAIGIAIYFGYGAFRSWLIAQLLIKYGLEGNAAAEMVLSGFSIWDLWSAYRSPGVAPAAVKEA